VTVGDGSAVVTGLLVAFCLPAQARWFVPIVAAFVAIAIAKQCFGGLGANIWNPALVGRAFVHISFPTDMNPATYPVLKGGYFAANVGTVGAGVPPGVDAVSAASPMAQLKTLAGEEIMQQVSLATDQTQATAEQIHQALDWALAYARGLFPATLTERLPGLGDMFLGRIGGSIGETSAVLLLLGALYLIYKGWIRWQVPIAYIATVAVGTLLLPLHAVCRAAAGETVLAEQAHNLWVLSMGTGTALRFLSYHLLGGGLALGAFFMATDMVTSPLTNRGLWIFGAGCGVLTILIRLYGGYPEAVCYSILLMNTAVPLIDRWTQPRIFGHKK
jgi:electron transport complex protein RnfD